MKKARSKLTEVKAEEPQEPEVVRRLTIQWRKDGSVQVQSDPVCPPYEILGLLVALVRQLGG